ncbi:hypothetical protein V3C99_008948, partial [Haemonchus contortus]|uniref:Secreted protein n=1 Tax=Haemonchus contortus TaxID=6289 RepID=A0A7I4YLQ4_HAECO
VMRVVQAIAFFCLVSQLYSRVVVGDANYYFKVLRLNSPPSPPSHSEPASRLLSLDRNCFFSPVQCMLPHNSMQQTI